VGGTSGSGFHELLPSLAPIFLSPLGSHSNCFVAIGPDKRLLSSCHRNEQYNMWEARQIPVLLLPTIKPHQQVLDLKDFCLHHLNLLLCGKMYFIISIHIIDFQIFAKMLYSFTLSGFVLFF